MNAPFRPPICPPPFPPWWTQKADCCWEMSKCLEDLVNKVLQKILADDPSLTGGVTSFNGRQGDVILLLQDIINAGGWNNVMLTGTPTAPTPVVGDNSTNIATTSWVNTAIQNAITAAVSGVASFNGRTGAVTLLLQDIIDAGGWNNALLTGNPTATTPAPGDNSQSLATTAFVQAAIAGASGAGNRTQVGGRRTIPSGGSGNIDFFTDFSQYELWELDFWDVELSGGSLFLQISTDGSTFLTAGYTNYGGVAGLYSLGIFIVDEKYPDPANQSHGTVRVALPGIGSRTKTWFTLAAGADWSAGGSNYQAAAFTQAGAHGANLNPVLGIRLLATDGTSSYTINRGNFGLYGISTT